MIEDFKLRPTHHTKEVLVRTSSENMTLYVSSRSVVSLGSKVYDLESGIDSCTVSLRSARRSANVGQLIYQGQGDADVVVDFSKYELLHRLQYTIFFEALNRAGMSTHVEAFMLLDDVPPIPGIVLGGITELDVRCQVSTQMIAVEWTPFMESETTILFHQVAVATAPYADLDQNIVHVGLHF